MPPSHSPFSLTLMIGSEPVFGAAGRLDPSGWADIDTSATPKLPELLIGAMVVSTAVEMFPPYLRVKLLSVVAAAVKQINDDDEKDTPF